MLEIQKMVEMFNLDRPIMSSADQNQDRQKELLMDEVEEAFEVLDDPQKLGTELADILWYVCVIANIHGIDLETEVREKATRNMCKYPSINFQSGDYQVERDRAIREWKEMRGEEWFYSIERTNPPISEK